MTRLTRLEEIIADITENRNYPQHTPLQHYPIDHLPSPTDTQKSQRTQFQIELENKLKTIREKMGESHGFGIDKLPLKNEADIDEIERSIMCSRPQQVVRSKTPDPPSDSMGTTPIHTPIVKHIDVDDNLEKQLPLSPNLLFPKSVPASIQIGIDYNKQ